MNEFARAQVLAELSHSTRERGVKENWQVVPVEPTDAMICAALDDHDKNYRQSYSDIYRAMLAAAPKPESYRLQIPSEFETKA